MCTAGDLRKQGTVQINLGVRLIVTVEAQSARIYVLLATWDLACALRSFVSEMIAQTTNTDVQARAAQGGGAQNVMAALTRAADRTGADFGYLLQTAMRESSLNPEAKASSSSATGLFQFIEQTWLGTMKQHGAEHGLAAYANAITANANGRYEVADPGLRREILALRKDADTAAVMAGEMTNDMRETMEASLGRQVTPGELYVAHFMGPAGALKLIKAVNDTPQASAAALMPEAAQANRRIFYTKSGDERTVSAVLNVLTRKNVGSSDTAEGAVPQTATVRRAVYETPASASEELRGAVDDIGSVGAGASGTTGLAKMMGQSFILAPLMVQMMAQLNPASAAGSENSERSTLLRRDDPLLSV